MILDALAEGGLYLPLHAGLSPAFAWLERHAAEAPDGKHEVVEGVTAIVQTYRTASAAEKKWETHRRNIDLQVVLSGSELVGWVPAAGLSVRTPYDPQKDAEFHEPPPDPGPRFRLRGGLFAIFFPGDAHQPGVIDGESGEVRKVVFKLGV